MTPSEITDEELAHLDWCRCFRCERVGTMRHYPAPQKALDGSVLLYCRNCYFLDSYDLVIVRGCWSAAGVSQAHPLKPSSR